MLRPEVVPAELRALPNWCVWKRVADPARPKPLKMPYGRGGRPLRTNDPRTFLTFEAALTLAAQLTTDGAAAYDGVGFVFTGTPYVGVDVDGTPPDQAVVLVQDLLPAYVEGSQSQNGLHVICRGTAPAGGKRRGNVEMYDGTSPRYFALTGAVDLPGLDPAVNAGPLADRTAALAAFHAAHIGGDAAQETAAPADQDAAGLTAADRAVLDAARAGKSARRLFALYDAGEFREGRRSEADFELATLLCRATPDDEAVIRLLAASALYREKWATERGAVTLLRWTVAQARKAAGTRDGEAGRPADQVTLRRAPELGRGEGKAWLPIPALRGKISTNAFAVLFGQSGVGKSFLALDWALQLADGGHAVVYVAAEGGEDELAERIDAWCAARGARPRPPLFLAAAQVVDLLDPTQLEELLAKARSALNGAGPVALTIFDTLNQNMPGGNENAAEDMSSVIGAANRIRNATGGAVLVTHHTRKGGDLERGHSSLRAAADAVLKIAADPANDDVRVLQCVKERGAAHFPDETFALVPSARSLVVARGPASGPGTPLTDTQRRWLEALDDATMAAGGKGANFADWEKAAAGSGLSTANTSRVIRGLLTGGHVLIEKSRYRRATGEERAVAAAQERALG